MDGFMFWRLAHPIVASASSQIDFLNTITVGLLDVLAVALLLLALATYFFYSRTRRQSTQGWGSAPRRTQKNVSTFASIMLAVPVVWLLVVWVGTSVGQSSSLPGQPTPTPTAKPGKMTPTPKANPAVTLAKDLVTPGTLTVGSATTNPPQEFLDPNTQQPIGFDVDLITHIAPKMGLQAKIVSTPFGSLFKDLRSRQFDVVISAVSMTSDLAGRYEFVSYLKTSESLLVPTGNAKHIKQITDLCGLSVGVQAGNTELTELQKATCTAGKVITIMQETNEADVIQLLLQGAVDATYQDTPVANYYIGLNQGKFAAVPIISNTPEEGIVIRKGDTVMLNAVQAAFNKLKHDGTYGSLISKWSLTNEAIAEIDRRSWSIA
jgi:polar amino acid transport system substrate-binding protein